MLKQKKQFFMLLVVISFIFLSSCSNGPNLLLKPLKGSEKIPVNFQIRDSQKDIDVVDRQTKQTVFTISTEVPIVNFGLNHNQSLLVILTTSAEDPIWFYDIEQRKFIHRQMLPEMPQFMVISPDDHYLALGNENSSNFWVLDLSSLDYHHVTFPHSVENAKLDQSTGKLLLRTEEEIMKLEFEDMEIVERNIKIPIRFGNEELWIEPTHLCAALPVDHPLYTSNTLAMQPDGLAAHIQKDLKIP